MLDLKLEYEYMKADIDAAIAKCMDHQKWILGPEVKELEGVIAAYLGVKRCVGVSSGTEALVLSLRALAIKSKGREYFEKFEEIITTPFTFTATGDAILRSGATPVFIDIDPDTYNMDIAAVEKYLAENPGKAVGIIPVHLYGQSCDMDALCSLAKKHGLFVVEDVAQAFGGDWKGKKLGSIGDLGAFSFFPSKNLGCFGDGGMVSTNDPELADLVTMLLKHGGKDKYNVDHVGYNARLDTLQAAVLLAKFKKIDEFNEKRIMLAAAYDAALKGVPGIKTPVRTKGARHVFHQYTISVDAERRDALQKYLAENGVDSMVYYPVALDRMKVFDGRCRVFGSLKNAQDATRAVLSLPMEPLQSPESTAHVAQTLKNFFGGR